MVASLLKGLTLAGAVVGSLGLTDHVKGNVRTNFGEDNRMIALNIEHISDKVHEILGEHSYDDIGHHGGALHLKLSQAAVAALQKEGVPHVDETEAFLGEMERNLNSENFFCMEGEACARKLADEFYAAYQPIEALHARIQGFATSFPSLASITTLGQSYEGREQLTILIGDQTKPLVWYYCNIHAREWLTPMFCTYMAETLVNNGTGHPLLEKFSFAVTPSVNPDGYVYSYTVNNAWRKTRMPNPMNAACAGTDGNRNYASGWGGPGSSSNPCSETYRGHTPFDQVETQNIRNFGLLHKDRLFSMNDVHSYGNYWMCPWAGTYELPPADDFDKMQTCNVAAFDAIKAAHGLSFSIGSVSNTIYIASGGAVDYFYDALGVVYAYTAEARSAGLGGIAGFQPPPSNIVPSNEELFAGMQASIECGYALSFGSPTPFPTGSPVECTDLNPNGIKYIDGTPAPCNELGAYCSVYSFVPERCPATCGECSAAVEFTGELKEVIIDNRSVSVKSLGNVVYVITGVAAVVAVGAIAMVGGFFFGRKKSIEQVKGEVVASGDI